MIYYFSGTGNSKWIAEELAKRTGDTAQSIVGLTQDGPAIVYAGKESRIGFVFPIYAWGAPELVERFAKSVTVGDGAYAFAVCTCGDEPGDAMKRFRRFFPYQGAWSFTMPNNYVIGVEVDAPELERQKIESARERLALVSGRILENAAEYDVTSGKAARLKTALIRPMFNAAARRTKPFFVTSACNGCGLCAKDCPTKAIELRSHKPVWVKRTCAMCTACINTCPTKAIQYGETTASHGRYHFSDMNV